MTHPLSWKKFHPLSDKNAFICLADKMGDDTAIAERARTSYGKDGKSLRQTRLRLWAERLNLPLLDYDVLNPGDEDVIITLDGGKRVLYKETSADIKFWSEIAPELSKAHKEDSSLIRRLMRDQHTSPFEMVEMVFLVQVPMDCWRQWVRHRTASINEYSTRYMEALDFFQVTLPEQWRLQATDNKQGSYGFLHAEIGNIISVQDLKDKFLYSQLHSEEEFPYSAEQAGSVLSKQETIFHSLAKKLYDLRLTLGIAKEQARKDLPLSTYTRAYWKCDLHNIFNFLRLRMDSHAQLEIRSFANSMFEIVKGICPVACEAFEDYILHAKRFSRMEMELLRELVTTDTDGFLCQADETRDDYIRVGKPHSMTDREWKEFLAKLS